MTASQEQSDIGLHCFGLHCFLMYFHVSYCKTLDICSIKILQFNRNNICHILILVVMIHYGSLRIIKEILCKFI